MRQDMNPRLTTEDIQGTIAYYTELLDFECDSHDEERGWVSVSREGINITFSVPDSQDSHSQGSQENSHFTGSVYIYADDVDSIWERIKGRVKICYPLESFSYGKREFGIYDNNGYLLKFGQLV